MISPLREKRFFKEMSLYDLALETDIDPARISLLERNYRVPKKDEKERLAKALNCRVEDIFPNNGDLNA
ncbi:MAG: helix-turn-helix transcriptional regulator [Candidatus Aminicenantes bacterium]|nr:MAG: helix-turn-helix transcriptional regulator [Candidatus Aminicenantes bacterium]